MTLLPPLQQGQHVIQLHLRSFFGCWGPTERLWKLHELWRLERHPRLFFPHFVVFPSSSRFGLFFYLLLSVSLHIHCSVAKISAALFHPCRWFVLRHLKFKWYLQHLGNNKSSKFPTFSKSLNHNLTQQTVNNKYIISKKKINSDAVCRHLVATQHFDWTRVEEQNWTLFLIHCSSQFHIMSFSSLVSLFKWKKIGWGAKHHGNVCSTTGGSLVVSWGDVTDYLP